MCPNTPIVPSSCRIRTHSPKPEAGPASSTVPSVTETIGVPIELAMSSP